MADPFIDAVKGGIGGFSEAISLADDLDKVAKQVGDLGKKEIAARAEWRRKAAVVNGDYAFLNAVEEYNRVKEAQTMREQVKQQVIAQYGKDAWNKVEEIERRQKQDFAKIYTEDGHDKKKLFQVKLACFAAALIITLILWANGIIHEMSIAFYGE